VSIFTTLSTPLVLVSPFFLYLYPFSFLLPFWRLCLYIRLPSLSLFSPLSPILSFYLSLLHSLAPSLPHSMDDMTLSTMTFSIMTLSIMTLSIMTLSIMTLRTITLSILINITVRRVFTEAGFHRSGFSPKRVFTEHSYKWSVHRTSFSPKRRVFTSSLSSPNIPKYYSFIGHIYSIPQLVSDLC
jgi:hypothetical protein